MGKNYHILVINPGSTSDEIAYFEGDREVFHKTSRYSPKDLEQYEKALQALSAGSSEKSPQGQLYLGRTQMQMNQLIEARDTFEKLVRQHETFSQAYYFLGESCGRLGDMFGAHYHLGRYYQQKGDLKNAGFHLNRALKLATDDAQKQLAERQLKSLEPQKGKKPKAG